MEKIPCGLPVSLTGRFSLQGIDALRGLVLWAEDLNASGGLRMTHEGPGTPVELIHYDDCSSPETVKTLVQRLIEEDGVDVLFGPYSSSLTLAALGVSGPARRVLWNHGGSTDDVYHSADGRIISCISPASHYMRGFLELIKTHLPAHTKVAVAFSESSGFSGQVASGALSCASTMGLEASGFPFATNTEDFSTLLSQLAAWDTNVLITAGGMQEEISLARLLVSERPSLLALSMVVAGIEQFGGELGGRAGGIMGPSQWSAEAVSKPDFGPTSAEFVSRFTKRYSATPDYTAAQAYNIGLVFQRCAEGTGSIDEDELMAAARELTFTTFYGDFALDGSTGVQTGHMLLTQQWRDGERVLLHPAHLARDEPRFPLWG